jgi:hypothetical protein
MMRAWRGLQLSVSPIAYQSHRAGAGFEKMAGGSATIF